jgi:hypothetical protein
LRDDVPDLVSDSDDKQSENEPKPTSLTGDPVQWGNCPESYVFVVLRKNLGWCRVVGIRMFPLRDFKRGPVGKQRIVIQAIAAFKALEADHAPKIQESAIKSLMLDENCDWLRTMACLQINNVKPND